jgi:threonine dehydratase
MVVSDEDIVQAVVRLLEEDKLVVETSAAAGAAALVRYHMNSSPKLKVAVVLTGGNISPKKLGELMFRDHHPEPDGVDRDFPTLTSRS